MEVAAGLLEVSLADNMLLTELCLEDFGGDKHWLSPFSAVNSMTIPVGIPSIFLLGQWQG